MQLTEVSINCGHICPQNLWLFANDVQVTHDAGLVAEGIDCKCDLSAASFEVSSIGFRFCDV